MRLSLTTFLLAILIFVGFTGSSLALTVDLPSAVRMALEKNLDLQAAVADAGAAEVFARGAYGIYDPLLTAGYKEGQSRTPLNFAFYQAKEKSDYRQVDAGLSQQLPTGATLALNLTTLREDVNPPPGVNPYYDGQLTLSLVQPLLRNFGRTVTEQDIRLAAKDRDISVEDLREQAFSTIAAVRDGYFVVLGFRDLISYRKTSVSLAERVLNENRRRTEVGLMAPVEVLEAEVGVKQRERELLDAQREYQNALDRLAVLLSLSGTLEVADDQMIVVDLPTDEERGYNLALENRPDVFRQQLQLDRLAVERTVAANQTLPAVDMVASFGRRGLGREESDIIDDLSGNSYNNWEVGVQLSYPLGNRAARNTLRQVEFRQQAQHARLAQLHEEVRREIREAIRQLDVSRKKVEVTGVGRNLAEERLRILLKRHEVGLETTRQVLQGEEDLAQARTDQILALAEYNQAVTAYYRVTGQLLKHEGVRVVDPVGKQAAPQVVIDAEQN